eukprot:m.18546 g.18546  ORF g.18546 m.18546 type:complete len:138 (-) comp8511_c0_seq1:150-563(-)
MRLLTACSICCIGLLVLLEVSAIAAIPNPGGVGRGDDDADDDDIVAPAIGADDDEYDEGADGIDGRAVPDRPADQQKQLAAAQQIQSRLQDISKARQLQEKSVDANAIQYLGDARSCKSFCLLSERTTSVLFSRVCG